MPRQKPGPAGILAGNTLGDEHKHWLRANFFQQYRLFFRYHASSKVIVLAWVNDEDTRRAYESGDDAYRVFCKMLENGHPPDDWNQLLALHKTKTSNARRASSHCDSNCANHGAVGCAHHSVAHSDCATRLVISCRKNNGKNNHFSHSTARLAAPGFLLSVNFDP